MRGGYLRAVSACASEQCGEHGERNHPRCIRCVLHASALGPGCHSNILPNDDAELDTLVDTAAWLPCGYAPVTWLGFGYGRRHYCR